MLVAAGLDSHGGFGSKVERDVGLGQPRARMDLLNLALGNGVFAVGIYIAVAPQAPEL